jgi:hypothetical protein
VGGEIVQRITSTMSCCPSHWLHTKGKHLLFWLANTVLFIYTNTFHSRAYLLSFWT